jgi:opacity protein-like surface antigen
MGCAISFEGTTMRNALTVCGTGENTAQGGMRMARTTTAALAQKALLVSAAALTASLIGSSGAWAQCRDSFNFVGIIGGVPTPVASLLPLGTGSSLSALTANINTVNTAFLTNTTAFVSAPGNPQPNQQGGGAWGRIIAGNVETNTSSVGTLDLTAVGLNATGTQRCDTTIKQDFWGYQVGHDISILNGGASGANWHFGVTAGYIEAKTKDKTPGGTFTKDNFVPPITFNTPPGSLTEDTQVPFAGIYTAYTKGGFYLDGQVRWDFYQNTLTDPLNGLNGQLLNAYGVSVTGNVGYNVPLGGGWFIEPSGGVVWSRTQIDPLNVAGLVNAGGAFARGTVTIEDIDSVLGRASVRVGTNFTTGGVAWQPFFTASIYHEFAGDVVARSVESGTGNALIDGIVLTSRSEGGIGTYGQFAVGTAAAILNTGWLGYARFDYRTGDNLDGWTINGGLRYQFTPGQRGSTKDGFAAAPDSYNWTGFYFGGSVGTAWGREPWFFTNAAGVRTGATVDNEVGGTLAGGQLGYNLQTGNIVLGVEVDYDWTNARGGKSCPNAFFFTCGGDTTELASVTGRVGYALGRALFYGKAGWAGGEVAPHGQRNTNQVALVNPVNQSEWLNGVTFGGGMEFALTNHVSAKAEWMHYKLGEENFQVSTGPEFADIRADVNVVRIGINVHLHPMRREERPLK